jgi:hypothetical protein
MTLLTETLYFRRMVQAILHLICLHRLMKLWRRLHLVVYWNFLLFLLMQSIKINAKKVCKAQETYCGVSVKVVLLLLEEDFLVRPS